MSGHNNEKLQELMSDLVAARAEYGYAEGKVHRLTREIDDLLYPDRTIHDLVNALTAVAKPVTGSVNHTLANVADQPSTSWYSRYAYEMILNDIPYVVDIRPRDMVVANKEDNQA